MDDLSVLKQSLASWSLLEISAAAVVFAGAVLVVLAVALIWPEVTRLGALGKPHPPPEGGMDDEEEMVEARRPGRMEAEDRT